jgi:hypothetical protein
LKNQHHVCEPNCLREFVEANRIGVSQLTASSDVADLILDGFRKSADNFGSHFELPGMRLMIQPERRSRR